VLDMVDIDSEKWRAYATTARAPMRQIWTREGRTLLALERRAAEVFDRSLFVSEEEAARFVELAPEARLRVDWVKNGVDLARFDPGEWHPRPYGPAPAIVFTGTMNYRPNVEAVCWFVAEVLQQLRRRDLAPEFFIVGANPAPAVQALAALPGVHVTGTVPDVRPYIAHAAVAVAPLHIARGIQNKVLEAMAMARPVIASPEAFEGIRAIPDQDLLLASSAAEWARRVGEVLDGAHPGLGMAARRAVATGHDWNAALRRLDAVLEADTSLSRAA
jgi:sugar transferase (PEP-CTERM/EpsH1 system associated)